MPVNKSALSRYRIIDDALRNKYRPYPTKQELINLIEEKLDERIGVRTLEQDIQDMRDDAGLSYYAPIKYDKTRKGYCYEDPDYTITGISIEKEDFKKLKFAAKVLSGFKNIPYLSELYRPIQQLERIIRAGSHTGQWTDNSVVQLEVPQQHTDIIIFEECIQAVLKKQAMNIRYKRFGRSESRPFRIHPYLLKEYKGRWYLVAKNVAYNDIRIYGLDRITSVKTLNATHTDEFDAEEYFRHALGITVLNHHQPETIELLFSPDDAHYILNSPIHDSQRILKNDDSGLHIELTLYPSYELTMLIRGYGSGVKVLKPERLRKEIVADAKKVVEG